MPFIAGAPVSGPHFVGRRDILQKIDVLVGGAQDGAVNHVLLLGLRRTGKSSILLNVKDRLASEPGVVPVILNVAGMPTRQRFAEAYMRAVLRAYADKTGGRALLEKTRLAVKEALEETGDGAEEPEAPVAEYVKFSAKFSDAGTAEDELVEDALGYPEALGGGGGPLFVVMIDEFQDIAEWGSQFLNTLRRTIQIQKSVMYIFAGSAPSMMKDMAYNPKAPFCLQLHDMRVGPLPEAEVLGFVKRRFRAAGMAVEDGAPGRIFEMSCGFPDYAQRLSLASFMRCAGQKKRTVTARDVDDAYADMLGQLSGIFEAQFAGLAAMEREVLIALSRNKNGTASISRAARVPQTSVPRALNRLISKDLIERHMEHRYRMTDSVFADWIARRYGEGLP